MKLIKVSQNDTILESLQFINQQAFPPNEYIPLHHFYQLPDSLPIDIWAMMEGEVACGFTVLMVLNKCAYIWYLAVDGTKRGMGYGSQTLLSLKNLYPDYQIVVDFEAVDQKYPNNEQRIRRTGFYIRNGFKLTTLHLFYMETEFVAAWTGRGADFDRKAFMNILTQLHRIVPEFDPDFQDKPIPDFVSAMQ